MAATMAEWVALFRRVERVVLSTPFAVLSESADFVIVRCVSLLCRFEVLVGARDRNRGRAHACGGERRALPPRPRALPSGGMPAGAAADAGSTAGSQPSQPRLRSSWESASRVEAPQSQQR